MDNFLICAIIETIARIARAIIRRSTMLNTTSINNLQLQDYNGLSTLVEDMLDTKDKKLVNRWQSLEFNSSRMEA